MLTRSAIPIAFDDVGDPGPRDPGPALLCMPGWCAHREVFRPLLAHAGRTRTLALDWRGHGGSGAAVDDYGTAQLVEDALAVIEHAGLAQVIPVGLAHAGWVAIELRRRLGAARVPGIVLLDWMVLGAPPPFLEALAGLQDPARWEPLRRALFEKWTTGVTLPSVDDNIARMASHGFDDWARAAREIARQFAGHGTPLAALQQLAPACPVLHLYAQPADDGFLEAQRALAREHPWFRVERLAARSHFPMLEVPAEVAGALARFAHGLAG